MWFLRGTLTKVCDRKDVQKLAITEGARCLWEWLLIVKATLGSYLHKELILTNGGLILATCATYEILR